MIHQLIKSIQSYFLAIQYMSKRSLWRWQIIPGIISFLLGALIFGLAYQFGDHLGEIMASWYPWEWGKSIVQTFFRIMGKILIVVTGLFAYRYILLIAISPLLSLLSEKVEQIYLDNPNHQEAGFSLRRLARDIKRGISLTLRNFTRELFYTMMLFLLSFIPGASVFTTPMTFGVQSFYAGFANMDFTMERYMNVKERVRFVRTNKGLAIGNGLVFLGLLMIPVIGLFLAPTLGVIASTLDVLDEIDDATIQHNNS
ncbi:MAG TPA: EI24 domain-containing protein [Saprospiraceae bacterium]|nr:EI24 domain-containing protein [Saprospiraceae bacterium]